VLGKSGTNANAETAGTSKNGDTVDNLTKYMLSAGTCHFYILEWIAEKDNNIEIYDESSIKFLHICPYEASPFSMRVKMQKILEDFRNEMSVFELWNKYKDQE
jgi:hypothetical protein